MKASVEAERSRRGSETYSPYGVESTNTFKTTSAVNNDVRRHLKGRKTSGDNAGERLLTGTERNDEMNASEHAQQQ